MEDPYPTRPQPRWLAIDRSRVMILVLFLLSGVSCRISYSVVSYLYVRFSGLITSVGKERANCSAIDYY